MEQVLEGLLFVSGSDGLSTKELSNILEIDEDNVLNLIDKLSNDYTNRGLRIVKLGEKYKLATKVEHNKYYIKLLDNVDDKLSQQALETLAIIAYNEPVTRSNLDELRGVDSSYQLRKLLLKGLICEDGRSDLPGRPMLYKTTSLFLDYFGLKSISDLPEIILEDSFDKEIELYNSKYKEF